MKEFLSQAAVPFTVCDIEEDEAAYTELIAKGFRTVPVTVIGNTTVKGFDEAALNAALAAWRAAS